MDPTTDKLVSCIAMLFVAWLVLIVVGVISVVAWRIVF